MSCNGIVSVSRVLGHDYDTVSPRQFRQRRARSFCGVLPPVEGAFNVSPLPMDCGIYSLQNENHWRYSKDCFRSIGEIFDPSARRYADRLSSFLRFEKWLNMDRGIEVPFYREDAPVEDLISKVYDPTLLWTDVHYKAGRRHPRLGEYMPVEDERRKIRGLSFSVSG